MVSNAESLGPLGMRDREKARITVANRDSIRERAFALHAQGLTYEEIGRMLHISKNTAMKYIHQELPRRRYEPEAKEVLTRVIASLKERHRVFQERFLLIEGNSTTEANSRAKWSRAIERIERDLLFLHGVKMPETDPEAILDKRGRRMDEDAKAMLKTVGYPELTEQAIVDRHIEKLDRDYEQEHGHPFMDRLKHVPPVEDDGGEYMVQNWDDDSPGEYDDGL